MTTPHETQPAHAPAPPRRRDRVRPTIGVLAALVAVWLGLAAPDVSPVAAVVPTAQVAPVTDVAASDQGVPQAPGEGRFDGGRR